MALSDEHDVKEVKEMIAYEKPVLVAGSPSCRAFFLPHARLLGPKQVQAEKEHAKNILHETISVYHQQRVEGRYFLHEHPVGCSSWDDPEMKKLQIEKEVYTVSSPICCYQIKHPHAQDIVIYKAMKWVTNSRVLAEALDKRCKDTKGQTWDRQATLVGGISHMTTSYTPALVDAVLKGLRSQMILDGQVSSLELKFAGPVPSETVFDSQDSEEVEKLTEYYDEITGALLPPDLVEKGKQEEIKWVKEIGLYTKIPRKEAKERGITIVPIKWVLTEKGDRDNPNVRCRLVGKELKAKTKDALLAHELFSAMPPWETVKVLLSLLVSSEVPDIDDDDDEELEMAIFDISRAHFMAPMDREACIELPVVDMLDTDGDVVGLLHKSMYGFRTASANWQRDWQQCLVAAGYRVGLANPALFFNQVEKSRGVVHGDDFVVVAGLLEYCNYMY